MGDFLRAVGYLWPLLLIAVIVTAWAIWSALDRNGEDDA